MSRFSRLLASAGAVALLAPAVASADPPWSAPAGIPGAGNGTAAVTAAGTPVVLNPANPSVAPNAPSVLLRLDPNAGTPRSTTGIALANAFAGAFATNSLAIAGTSIGTSGTIDTTSRVRAGTVSASGGAPTLRTLSGTQNQNVEGIAGNSRGDSAFVTAGGSQRMVFLRRHGTSTFSRILTIPVSSQGRNVQVALGPSGDVLVVWEDRHEIMARHRGAKGTWGATHRLGAGVQSRLQAAVDSTGRLEVAWASQRVNEGEAATSPTIDFVTAAPGHNFGSVRTIEAGSPAAGGTGSVAVDAPAVRLVVTASSRAVLAWTSFDGTRFAVKQRAISAGHLGTVQQLSPDADDAVLGDVAAGTPGGTADAPLVVEWRAAPHGTPPGTARRVFAAVKGAGATAFGAPEAVSEPNADVVFSPTALLASTTARPIAVFSNLTPASGPATESAIRTPIAP